MKILSEIETFLFTLAIPFVTGTATLCVVWSNWDHIFSSFSTEVAVVGTVSIAFASAMPLVMAYTAIDLQVIKIAAKHKIQKDKKLCNDEVWKAVSMLKWEFLQAIPTFYCYARCLPEKMVKMPENWDIPSLAGKFFAVVCLQEICFYTSHRILHTRTLYKHIHKRHHEYKAPTASVGTYAHPIEHQLSLLPVLFLPYVVGLPLAVALFWYFIAYFSVLNHHSGYEFPWLPGNLATFHDLHHRHFDKNFGIFGWMDRVFGGSFDTPQDS
eukprot:TRINITY_DN6720_c0_g1_i1.p1 TRINITY_DN6720_c0_g1~~TRINITY_DN6720_c0_g1_i1.p1  ORF type:complete len:284 (+),score=45.36 TRINITY_DN6720_c0_g1_i1:46-852(+)